MKRFVVFNAITAALGGFLFGFDTAVISGAEQDIQHLWGLSQLQLGFAVAIALYGTVIGAMFGGFPSNLLGRKKTLIIIGILYFISALGSALAPDVNTFLIFRFIGGIGVGVSSVAAPLFISEISPPQFRGRLVGIFQFNIVFGILVAFFSNYLLNDISPQDWRWMLGVEAIPAFIYLVLVGFIEESPRWLLVKKDNEPEARRILNKIDPDHVDRLVLEIHASKERKKEWLFSGKFSKPIVLVLLFATFNQFSGINAIIYYAPRIFKTAGFEASASLLSTVGIGFVNLVFTMLGMAIIDKAGRKKLMYIGSFGLIAALFLIGTYIGANFDWIFIFFFIYIAFFAMSQGAIIWVFISEIFPNAVRAYGQALGSFTHWIFAAIITNAFPYFTHKFQDDQGPIFYFFCAMMVLQLLFVWKLMPETKGISLEEMEKKIGVK